MFQRIISRIFKSRHYWRTLSFDEVAELYTSRLVTVFAINVVNLFAAVYLYKLGYSIPGPKYPDRKVVGCMAFPPGCLAAFG